VLITLKARQNIVVNSDTLGYTAALGHIVLPVVHSSVLLALSFDHVLVIWVLVLTSFILNFVAFLPFKSISELPIG